MDLRAVSVHVLYLSHKHVNRLPVISSDQHQEMEVYFEKLTISLQVDSAEAWKDHNRVMHKKMKLSNAQEKMHSKVNKFKVDSVLLSLDSHISPHYARSATWFIYGLSNLLSDFLSKAPSPHWNLEFSKVLNLRILKVSAHTWLF
jgi:hypothetical protein